MIAGATGWATTALMASPLVALRAGPLGPRSAAAACVWWCPAPRSRLHRCGFELLDGEVAGHDTRDLRREQRSGQHLTCRAARDDLAVAEHGRARCAPSGELDVVGGEHHGAAGVAM